MQVRSIAVVLCVMLLAGFVTVRAEETDKPKKEKATAAKVVQPWSKISSLSEDQKSKIKEIHAAALEEIRKIKEKENADIMAVLTDEQKAELKELQEKEKADKKAAKKEEPAT